MSSEDGDGGMGYTIWGVWGYLVWLWNLGPKLTTLVRRACENYERLLLLLLWLRLRLPSCEFVKRDERMAVGSSMGIPAGQARPGPTRLHCTMCNTRSCRSAREHLKLTHKIYIIIAKPATLTVTAVERTVSCCV